MVDQLAAPFLRAYGHGVTKTPSIDRIAESGVVFENAYTPSPLCAPARASFMTGQLPSRTRVYDNSAEFASSIPTFAHYLRLEGYRTCLSGKMHFVGPDQLHGFEERLTTDVYPGDFGWTPDWSRPGERIDWWYHNMSSVEEAGVAELTNQLEYDDEVAFHAIRRLYDYVRFEGDDEPLMLCVSFTHPHDPYVARQRYWDLYEDDEIDLPAAPGLPYEERDAHGRRLFDDCAVGALELTDERIRRARHGFYANLSYVDAKIGEVLDAFEACGLAEDAVVIFTSDHGDFLGEHGLFYKMSFREHSAHVPLIVSAPGRFAPRRVPEAVSLLDLAPTLADLARPGLSDELSAPIDGESLLPFLEGETDPERTIAGEYLAESALAPMVMLRRGRFKLVHTPSDPDALFDLEADPLELLNVADDPECADVLAELRAEVARRWDLDTLDSEVRASQRARHTVFQALRQGAPFPWDFQPSRAAAKQYTRNTDDVAERDRQARFPPYAP